MCKSQGGLAANIKLHFYIKPWALYEWSFSGRTALHCAAKNSQAQILEKLLQVLILKVHRTIDVISTPLSTCIWIRQEKVAIGTLHLWKIEMSIWICKQYIIVMSYCYITCLLSINFYHHWVVFSQVRNIVAICIQSQNDLFVFDRWTTIVTPRTILGWQPCIMRVSQGVKSVRRYSLPSMHPSIIQIR